MHKMMRATAVLVLTLVTVLALAPAASGQAAAEGCPPGQPPGRPPGTPPNEPPPQSNRPNYPPGRCQFGLSQNAAERGQTFRATGNGFVPGETVVLSIAGLRAGSGLVGADGAFTAQLTVPAAAPLGRTQVLATGQTQELSADFEVLGTATAGAAAPADRGGSSLPRTGAELTAMGLFGAVLTAAGALLVLAARQRRRAIS